jgi:hypothetical protein
MLSGTHSLGGVVGAQKSEEQSCCRQHVETSVVWCALLYPGESGVPVAFSCCAEDERMC